MSVYPSEMQITLVRDERSGEDGQEGRLFLNGLFVGPTLERREVMVKPGVWRVRRHESPSFKRSTIHLFERASDGLSMGYILIHEGGVPSHSRGCILLGKNDLEGARISGGMPIVRWLEMVVFEMLALGRPVTVTVCEASGDVLDGEVS